MKKLLNISCTKATLLISKKEDGKLAFIDKVRLRLHLGICSACRLFEKQSFFFSSNAKHAHLHSDACLTDAQKERMKKELEEA